MSDIAIKTQNLGKKYRIRHDTQEKYQTIRETLMRKFSSLIHPLKTSRASNEDFWLECFNKHEEELEYCNKNNLKVIELRK